MHLFDQRFFGIIMLALIAILVITKQVATGSLLKDKPTHGFWLWVVHIFNMFFLLIINPITAILLTIRKMETIDTTRFTIKPLTISYSFEVLGILAVLTGYILMALSLVRLGHNYQVGGSQPRGSDKLTVSGPYKLIRHPMYTSALCISLGLALVLQSLSFFVLFLIYSILVILLIPYEERGLALVYGDDYISYQKKSMKLIPFVY